MTAPTTVYTILQKNTLGYSRGFEKGDGHYYLDHVSARDAHDSEPLEYQRNYAIVECVIMSRKEYDELIQQLPSNKV